MFTVLRYLVRTLLLGWVLRRLGRWLPILRRLWRLRF